MYDDIGETHSHSITDFLSRYIIIAQGTWEAAQSRGTVLQNMVFPKQLFNTGSAEVPFNVTQNINKLEGFLGLKAKVRIRIEVNSQPFQAGALLLHYVPYSEYMNSHTQWYATDTNTNVTAASGCPHVVMNLANTTSMEFCTPFISPYLFFGLPTGQGSFGNVVISVLSPISSLVSSSVSYTVWAKFEDIDLRFPTDAPLTTNFAQIGTELSTMESRGTISSTVGTVGRIAASVLPWVGLNWLSSPVASLSSGAEQILKHLGFSKPVVEAPVTRVKATPAQYFLNHDGSDTSHKLALSAENALTQFSGWAGTDVDEMRLDYIASRPCFLTSFEWDTTQAAKTNIFQWPVAPLWAQIPAAKIPLCSTQATSMTLCARVASFYSTWRGTMVYRFHVVKTQFHSGRLRVSFRPGIYSSNTTISNMPAFAYTEEVDLSSGTDFTFKIPFVSIRPWLHNSFDLNTSITSGDARNCSTGIIELAVINPLVSAPTVASSVDVLVFVSMEDAQFGAPVRPQYTPFGIPNVAQIGDHAQIGKPTLVTPQNATQSVSRADLSLLPYASCMGEVISSFRQLAKRFSRVASITLATAAPDSTAKTSSCNGFVLFPWAPVTPPNGIIQITPEGKTKPPYVNKYEHTPLVDSVPRATVYNFHDTYSQLYSMYAFFRGSIRYKITVTSYGPNFDLSKPVYVYINNLAPTINGNLVPYMQSRTATDSGPSSNLTSGPVQPLMDIPKPTSLPAKIGYAYQPELTADCAVMFLDKEGSIEFEVPFHATGPFCPTNYGLNNTVKTRSIFTPFPIVTIKGAQAYQGIDNVDVPNPTGTLQGCSFDVYRAIGDDFSFGGLLGTPPTTLWSSINNPA